MRSGDYRGWLEGLYGLGLDGVDLADGDGGDVEVFAARGRAGEAAEHGELAGVVSASATGPCMRRSMGA